MEGIRITEAHLAAFVSQMTLEEKSKNTVEKYTRDIRKFLRFTQENEVDKETVISYKQKLLEESYTVCSINSMLASVNSFFDFLGLHAYKVKSLKQQKRLYCPEEKELTRAEYLRLVEAAKQNKNKRLWMILQTICGTGIRVSELRFFTVEAVKEGQVTVDCKGKRRSVFLVPKLRKKLLSYAAKRGIAGGPVFVTRTGRSVSRIHIWREMKRLCVQAGVSSGKVFPHNLRHLFARTFYRIEKDIAKLADILGHSSIDTTRIYIISTGREHRRQMERMQLIQ